MGGRNIVLALAALALLACEDDATGPGEMGRVEVRFETAMSATGQGAPEGVGAAAVPIVGSNGTLEIESVLMIVGELELEAAEGSCPEDGSEGDDEDAGEEEGCEEIEANPFLLDLPLDGEAAAVAIADVRPGTYTAFEFEVEDVEADEDDDQADRLAAVLADARAVHADWPGEASMVVEGTFTAAGGESRPFRAFVDAEIEIGSTLAEPLVVDADGTATITVVLDPEVWFTRPDGAVLDLSLYDFTGEGSALLELEVELEEGLVEIEVDDD